MSRREKLNDIFMKSVTNIEIFSLIFEEMKNTFFTA